MSKSLTTVPVTRANDFVSFREVNNSAGKLCGFVTVFIRKANVAKSFPMGEIQNQINQVKFILKKLDNLN